MEQNSNNVALNLAKKERKDQADLIRDQKSFEDKERILEILKRDTQYTENKRLVRNERDSNKLEQLGSQEEKLQKKLSEIQSTKERISKRMESEEQSIENLPNTAQAQKRADMVTYAKEHDQSHAERVAGRHAKIQELRVIGVISDSAEGVTIRGIGTLASTATHNSILNEKFASKVQEPFNRTDHSGNGSQVSTIRKDYLETYLNENDGELVSGSFRMPGQDFVTGTIFPWIENTFGGGLDQHDKLYILQMINPDLFTWFWFNSTEGSRRLAMGLLRLVIDRSFKTDSDGYSRCGVFLIGNA